ncbi:hypothetical protein L211DRAFT_866132 [Terfezia boudieri ATCC MYA-4762]|uniref:Uncharacterized protein n=1 Tax=Terfezia boudieri ATCC MYA-4762 TaxID=1051890 RepID=A0A3N4LWK0_9PEZI|nr:hypothetical protein L211DRAFT_866132 [Terfezia boudieri ATCC MYA-4762]
MPRVSDKRLLIDWFLESLEREIEGRAFQAEDNDMGEGSDESLSLSLTLSSSSGSESSFSIFKGEGQVIPAPVPSIPEISGAKVTRFPGGVVKHYTSLAKSPLVISHVRLGCIRLTSHVTLAASLARQEPRPTVIRHEVMGISTT